MISTLRNYLFISLFIFPVFLFAQSKTIISGTITDSKTNEALEYVNIQFEEGTLGVSSDRFGHYLLEKTTKSKKIKVSYVGYTTQTINVKNGVLNEINIKLVENESQLSEITVRPIKYQRKNPAVDLINEVFAHKEQNRKEGLNYYQYDDYEKMRFEINGVSEKFRKKWYFKRFQYAFKFCDTNKINQKITLPFYFRERLQTSYFRKNPYSIKDKLWAEKQSAFEDDYDVDQDGISTYINQMYSEIDIYEPTIKLLDKQFVGPLSSVATTFYRFYITDTVSLDSQRFAAVYFAPFNKNDLAFIGTMLVALDGSYAVKSVDMGIPKDINLNWVSEIKVKQNFKFQGDSSNHRLLLDNDELTFDFKVWKKEDGRSLLATRRNYYQHYLLNPVLSDSLFKGPKRLIKDTGNLQRNNPYWVTHRLDSLTDKEKGITTMLDSIKNMRLVKNLNTFGRIMGTGYVNIGKLQLGDITSLYRYNNVEGNRFQLTLRTRNKYFKKYRLRAYAAYGMKDKAWKYGGSGTFSFNGAQPGRFPVNQLKISYENDLFLPGLSTSSGENLVGSLQSNPTSRLLRNQNYRLDYSREYEQGFSYQINAARKAVNQVTNVINDTQNPNNQSITTEIGFWIRYAPNEKFYQGPTERYRIPSKAPVFMLGYRSGLKGVLGGQYSYQKTYLRMVKRMYLAPFGRGNFTAETGAILGQVSYPFLEIHRANRSYFLDDAGFNLMNYLEFVSDKYAQLHYNHDFGGIILNRIPLIKKLKWREAMSFNMLYGSLSDKNIPNASNGLQAFPKNAAGNTVTQGLGKTPYMEISAGLGNIFNFLRVDYVWRLTYLDLPNVQKNGIKLSFSTEF